MKMSRFGLCSLGILALAASLAAQAPAGAPAGAQGRGTPAPPQNLQVLPQGTDIRATMQAFAQGLGVQCAYCHVAEGRGGRNDFAADDKPQKKVARAMIKMVMQDNDMIAAATGKTAADVVKVQCATCHRGQAIPKVELPSPAAPAAAPGH